MYSLKVISEFVQIMYLMSETAAVAPLLVMVAPVQLLAGLHSDVACR